MAITSEEKKVWNREADYTAYKGPYDPTLYPNQMFIHIFSIENYMGDGKGGLHV